MIDIERIDRQSVDGLRYVMHDVDDTITDDGKLTAEAYTALWRLREIGLKVISVTGRPAGWCDMMARQWPVDAVIGENGALTFYERAGRMHHIYHPAADRERGREILQRIEQRTLREVPGCAVARDQFGRLFDLALDFAEDATLGLSEAEKILAICREEGATAKISSIHVNTWCGDYDKLSMTELTLAELFAYDGDRRQVMFFGDSPNDEPMFAHFPLSCGVANIRSCIKIMKHLPTYVTSQCGGHGFAEAVRIICQHRYTGQRLIYG